MKKRKSSKRLTRAYKLKSNLKTLPIANTDQIYFTSEEVISPGAKLGGMEKSYLVRHRLILNVNNQKFLVGNIFEDFEDPLRLKPIITWYPQSEPIKESFWTDFKDIFSGK